jgi:hypothetical protein
MQDFEGIIICGFVFILMIVLGFVLRSGKGAFLISGYNMLPKEKKARYNEKELCRFTGNLLFTMAFLLIFAILGAFYEIFWLVKLIVVLFILTALAGIIYVNTNSRFKNQIN